MFRSIIFCDRVDVLYSVVLKYVGSSKFGKLTMFFFYTHTLDLHHQLSEQRVVSVPSFHRRLQPYNCTELTIYGQVVDRK